MSTSNRRIFRKKDRRGDPIRWPQPAFDAVLMQALYSRELRILEAAVRRMERCSMRGLRHFSDLQYGVPLSMAAVAAVAIADREREELTRLGLSFHRTKVADLSIP